MEKRRLNSLATGIRTRSRYHVWLTNSVCCSMTLWLVCCQTGCQLFDRFRAQPAIASPVAFHETPAKEQILAHLVSQARQVKQLQTDVRVSMDGMPTLRGTLAVERPDRLRLNAGLLGVSELGVDVGSNAERFWFWTKVAAPGEEPGIYYANHEQYRSSALHRAIPIEPAWLIDALGLVQFEPDDLIEGPFPRPDGRLELRTYRKHADRVTVRVCVIDPTYGWVNQIAMYDSSGRLIAYADSIKYQHYPEHNVNLPSRIEITAYDVAGSEVKLAIDANGYRLNSIFGDPEKLWTMPNPGNIPLIDLVSSESKTADIEIGTGQSANPRSYDHRTSSHNRIHSDFTASQLR